MAAAKEPGNVRAACRIFGIHHSTYYRWRTQMVRHGTTARAAAVPLPPLARGL